MMNPAILSGKDDFTTNSNANSSVAKLSLFKDDKVNVETVDKMSGMSDINESHCEQTRLFLLLMWFLLYYLLWFLLLLMFRLLLVLSFVLLLLLMFILFLLYLLRTKSENKWVWWDKTEVKILWQDACFWKTKVVHAHQPDVEKDYYSWHALCTYNISYCYNPHVLFETLCYP